jgi:hypothetical protein
LLYLIHNCAVLCTNNRYWTQCAHSDAGKRVTIHHSTFHTRKSRRRHRRRQYA